MKFSKFPRPKMNRNFKCHIVYESYNMTYTVYDIPGGKIYMISVCLVISANSFDMGRVVFKGNFNLKLRKFKMLHFRTVFIRFN